MGNLSLGGRRIAMRKSSVIRQVPFFGNGNDGPDTMYVVDFYENEKKVATTEFPNKSIHYVESAARNWDNGILKNGK